MFHLAIHLQFLYSTLLWSSQNREPQFSGDQPIRGHFFGSRPRLSLPVCAKSEKFISAKHKRDLPMLRDWQPLSLTQSYVGAVLGSGLAPIGSVLRLKP